MHIDFIFWNGFKVINLLFFFFFVFVCVDAVIIWYFFYLNFQWIINNRNKWNIGLECRTFSSTMKKLHRVIVIVKYEMKTKKNSRKTTAHRLALPRKLDIIKLK